MCRSANAEPDGELKATGLGELGTCILVAHSFEEVVERQDTGTPDEGQHRMVVAVPPPSRRKQRHVLADVRITGHLGEHRELNGRECCEPDCLAKLAHIAVESTVQSPLPAAE